MKEGAVFYFENRPTGKAEVVTFNNETPYVFGTLSTLNGPLVFDVPAAGTAAKFSGSIFDLWYFPMEDIGPAGADEGKGGKYLVLPPDYQEDVPNQYIPLRSRTHEVHMLFRSIPAAGGDEGLSGKLSSYGPRNVPWKPDGDRLCTTKAAPMGSGDCADRLSVFHHLRLQLHPSEESRDWQSFEAF